MRKPLIVSAASALAAAALVAGAGTAAAQAEGEVGNIAPPSGVTAEHSTTFGYGSLGTGSLADLVSQLVMTGSGVLSLDIPNLSGSYAPGSFGSYGPEAIIGELSATATGSLIQGSLGS